MSSCKKKNYLDNLRETKNWIFFKIDKYRKLSPLSFVEKVPKGFNRFKENGFNIYGNYSDFQKSFPLFPCLVCGTCIIDVMRLRNKNIAGCNRIQYSYRKL